MLLIPMENSYYILSLIANLSKIWDMKVKKKNFSKSTLIVNATTLLHPLGAERRHYSEP